jgi:hypothetical protein
MKEVTAEKVVITGRKRPLEIDSGKPFMGTLCIDHQGSGVQFGSFAESAGGSFMIELTFFAG